MQSFTSIYSFIFIVFISLSSCGTTTPTSNPKNDGTQTNQQTNPPVQNIPPMPLAQMVELQKKVDNVDYISNTLPISFNSNGPQAQNDITYLDPAGATMNANCAEFAMAFYTGNGEELATARIYYGNDCTYYVFINEKQEPIYVNKMSDNGIKFFGQILANVKATMQKRGE